MAEKDKKEIGKMLKWPGTASFLEQFRKEKL